MSKSWDNGILKKLKALVGKGLSTAEIGKKLGMSKNAVVGKLHRMGWSANTSESGATKTGKDAAKKPSTKVAARKVAVVKPTKTVKPAKPIKVPKAAKPAKSTLKSAGTVSKAKKIAKTSLAEKPKKAVGRSISVRGTEVHQRIVQHALEMANLKPNQCRWPIGDPDSEDFHFCGQTVFVGKPYCYEHCKQAYQFTPPKKK